MNAMREIFIGKIVVNMGIGESREDIKKAEEILVQITGAKTVRTKAKVKQPKWNIRPGLEIGVKTTLRGEKAESFLENALVAMDNTLSRKCFDERGNFGFGVKEHIELPKVKYDPKLGIKGFDVLVSLERRGYRVKRRKSRKKKIGKWHVISKEEAIAYMKEKFSVSVE